MKLKTMLATLLLAMLPFVSFSQKGQLNLIPKPQSVCIGRGKFVIMDIEDYERAQAEKKLLLMLHEAEESVNDPSAWLSPKQAKAVLGVK